MPGPSEGVPRVACKVLDDYDATNTIRELNINLSHMARGESAVQVLCKSLQPSQMRLHTLILFGVNLSSGHTLLSALQFPFLSSLTIAGCIHTEDFVTALGSLAVKSPMTLESLTIHQSQIWDRNDASEDSNDTPPEPLVAALDLLLGNSTALQQIWICLRGFRTLPLVQGFANQGLTLRWLFLDVRAAKGVPDSLAYSYNIDDWQRLCQSLKQVRQLDMIFPRIMIDDRQGDKGEMDSFIVSRVPPSHANPVSASSI
ncbi:MAG: hypothetical protein Q9169_007301 [Polycauliona sp. 2 TL-2023]